MIFVGLALIGVVFLEDIEENPFGMMEIKGTHIRDRDVRDMPYEKRSDKRKRAVRNYTHSEVEIVSSVMERALEVQSNLDTHFPLHKANDSIKCHRRLLAVSAKVVLRLAFAKP